MINGAHVIVQSTNSDADRGFLRDVLGFPHVDVGGGWLIFALPPAEVAVHPAGASSHELYLMCDDVRAFTQAMKKKKIACTPVQNQGWGLLTSLTLPGGGKLGVYEPRHARPGMDAPSAPAKPARKAAAKATAKTAKGAPKPKTTTKAVAKKPAPKQSAPKATPVKATAPKATPKPAKVKPKLAKAKARKSR